jgi:hypothetical protein
MGRSAVVSQVIDDDDIWGYKPSWRDVLFGRPDDLKPEDVLKTVRLAMPNLIRNKIFTEFAMQAPDDHINYIHPVFQKKKDKNGN